MSFPFKSATRALLHVYLMHTLLVPFLFLWFVCTQHPESRFVTQFIGLIPAVLFLALTALWTELPGRFSKALLVTLLTPFEVGVSMWFLETDLYFYWVEVFFVDVVSMGVAFIGMSFLQLQEKARPVLAGVIFVGTSLLAFGSPIVEAYRNEALVWQVFLVAMILTEAWAYMYIFANKAVPFRPLQSEKRSGLLDRWLPDEFEPVGWGTNDVVATSVVVGGLLAWLVLPFVI